MKIVRFSQNGHTPRLGCYVHQDEVMELAARAVSPSSPHTAWSVPPLLPTPSFRRAHVASWREASPPRRCWRRCWKGSRLGRLSP
jgi:hypothetical protein